MSEKDSLFSRLFYAGVGFGAMTVEKLEKSLSKVFKQASVDLGEFKESINKTIKELGKKKDKVQEEMEQFVAQYIEKFKYAKQKDLEQILKRIEDLEKKLEQAAKNNSDENK